MTKNVISAPLIGHGNPFAAEAILRLGEAEGISSELVYQKTIPRLANLAHQFRTSVPALAERYTKDSSAREGVLAKAFGRLSFLELSHRLGDTEPGTTLHLTQEHVLLGTPQERLQGRGIDHVNLLVPDVYPKSSGKAALAKYVGSTALVWNRPCYDELTAEGLQAKLVKPFYLDAFSPDLDQFNRVGRKVVAKISGSGMPRQWRKQLSGAMSCLEDPDWSVHYPEIISSGQGDQAIDCLNDSIEGFFGDLGSNTRVVIGFPSELVNVVFDMKSRGVPVVMITLPPRGEHEYRNLQTAVQHGLAVAELRFDDRPPTIDGLGAIYCSDLGGSITNLQRDVEIDDQFLGTMPYWRSLISSHV